MVPHLTTIAEFLAASTEHGAVVIDAYADWCGPCKQMAPLFEMLATKHTNVAFYKVNTDAAQDLASHLCVTSLPTFLIVRGGHVVDTIIGANRDRLQTAVAALAANVT